MEQPKYLHQEKFLTNRIKETLSYEVIISFQMFVGFWWCLYANSQFCLEWEKSPLSCSDKKLSLGRRPLPQLAFRLGFFLHTLPSAPFTLQKAFTLLFWNTVKSWLFNLKKGTASPHLTPLINILNQGLPLTACVQYLPQHGNLIWNLSQLLPPMWRSSSVHVPGGLRPSSASLNLFSKGSFLPNPQSPTAACFTVEELKTSPTVTNTDKAVIVLRCQRFKHAANPQFYHYLVINLDYKTNPNNFSTTISSLNIQFHIWVSHLQYFQSHFWMRPSSYISLVFLRNTLTHCLISLRFSCLQFEMFVCP